MLLLCCAEYEVPSATAVLPNMRRVYRLLKLRDVKPTLKDTEVHILWPDNGIWYLAEVLEVRRPVQQLTACSMLMADPTVEAVLQTALHVPYTSCKCIKCLTRLWLISAVWLLCLVPQFDAHQKTALVVYPETHEEEWINLVELVQEKCIAVGE